MFNIDIIQNVVGEYTLLTIVLIVLSVFLDKFVPPLLLQWRFIIVAITGMTIAYLMPPNDWQALMYGFSIAGLVVYKNVLVNEIRMVLSIAKKQNCECEKKEE